MRMILLKFKLAHQYITTVFHLKVFFTVGLYFSLLLDFSVDMTLDKAVRVVNYRSRIAISLSSSAGSAALIHPNGRVYQYGSRVEIVAYDGMKNNNYV